MSDERSVAAVRRWRDLWKKRYISLRGELRSGRLVRSPKEFNIVRERNAWSGDVEGFNGRITAVGKTPAEVAQGLMDGLFLMAKHRPKP